MQTVARSPRISHISWGRLEVEGHPPFKDAKAACSTRPVEGAAISSCLVGYQ